MSSLMWFKSLQATFFFVSVNFFIFPLTMSTLRQMGQCCFSNTAHICLFATSLPLYCRFFASSKAAMSTVLPDAHLWQQLFGHFSLDILEVLEWRPALQWVCQYRLKDKLILATFNRSRSICSGCWRPANMLARIGQEHQTLPLWQ